MKKIIINACLTGMVPQKRDNPHVPITPKEIIKDALELAEIGVTVVHIHPRDKDGKPTWKKEFFEEIIRGIREKNKDLLISVTTTGRFWDEFEKRSACLELKGKLKPDLASLTIGSFNFIKDMSINSPEMIQGLAEKMVKNGIKPEIEIFDQGMIHKAKYLIKKGIIPDKNPYFNLFFGSLGTAPLEASPVASFLSTLPDNAIWSAAGLGSFQLDANLLGISLGGNIRVGLEDNIYFDRRRKVKASNKMLVKRMLKVIKEADLGVATPEETRELLGIKKRAKDKE